MPKIHGCVTTFSRAFFDFGFSHTVVYIMDFVSPIPSDLQVECAICYGLLLNPHLTECCGHHFCRDCINKVSKQKKPCPLCNTPEFNSMHDKSLSRVISGLKVNCTYKERGCEWQGEIRALDSHLKKGEREGECQYVPLLCINRCGDKVERHLLRKHEDSFCSKRPSFSSVEICRRMDELTRENESLKLTVENLSRLNAINKHEISSLTQQLNTHSAEFNALKQSLQTFSRTGKLKMPESFPSAPLQHDTLLPMATASPCSHVTVSNPSTETSLRIVPYEFKFDNYERRFKNSEMWMSRPFFTHAGGYKMCVRVTAKGTGNGESTHVSVHVYLMKGEYDHLLTWPFRGSIIIRLVNQIGDECHHEQTTKFTDKTPNQYCSRFVHSDVLSTL